MTATAALIRWVHLLSLMAVFGASAFAWLLARGTGIAAMLPRPWVSLGVVLATATALVQLLLTAANMTGNLAGAFEPAVLTLVLKHTLFGQLFLVRAAALVALVALAAMARSNMPLIALVSAVALGCIGFTSHAAASGHQAFMLWRVGNDAIHLLTGGFWLGGLAVLFHLARTEPTANLYRAVSLFSESAIYAVTLLALAGMINAGLIFGAQRVTWTYMLLLAAKVVLAVGMLLLAFINRLRVMPALEEGRDAPVLARNILAELILGAGVVAIAAILGSIPPG